MLGEKVFSTIILIFGNVPHPSDLGVKVGQWVRLDAFDKWGFGYLISWFVGCTSCTLQTLYAWLVRGFWYCMVGILI